MVRFRRPPQSRDLLASADDHKLLLMRWTARILLGLPQFRVKKDWGLLPDLADYLGLELEGPRVKVSLEKVQEQARLILKKKAVEPKHDLLRENLARLGDSLGLSAVELEILRFRVLLHTPTVFRSLCMEMGPVRMDKLIELLSVMLERTTAEVADALRSGNRLSRAGLLQLTEWGDLEDRLQLMDSLYKLSVVEAKDSFDLFRAVLVTAPAGTLGLANYPHLEPQLAILEPYLASASASGRAGVNVLFYGSPGTGKTELARALAQATDQELMEVALEGEDGEPLRSSARWSAYRLAQRLLRPGSGKLLLVDEVESLLAEEQTGGSPRSRDTDGWKAWINRALETNPIPTVWITNKPWALDAAFRRRFDLTLEIEVPPRSVRRALIESKTEALKVSPRFKERLAEEADLSPANLDRAVKVLAGVPNLGDEAATEQVFATLLDQQKKFRGGSFEWKAEAAPGLGYQMDWLNTDISLERVIEGLRASGSGRLCLYGLPGTGKSAFAKELAKALDRPFVLKRASDIFGMYVGQTEQNIARAFREASQERAVLVLDEADSFLQDRRNAVRSWETTQVNELLTQMEAFDGVFVATTNLVDNLDPASLRRFDMKVKFGALRPEQCESVAEALARAVGFELDAPLRARARALRAFTPGDTAALLRQARFNPPADAAELIARLEGEVRHDKGGDKGKVGF